MTCLAEAAVSGVSHACPQPLLTTPQAAVMALNVPRAGQFAAARTAPGTSVKPPPIPRVAALFQMTSPAKNQGLPAC